MNTAKYMKLVSLKRSRWGKGKGNFHPRTAHEGPKGEYRYSPTISLTSGLDGGGWSTPSPGHFTPGKDPVPLVWEVGWATGPVWKGVDNLAHAGIRSPDRPARNESLYRPTKKE